METDNKNIAKVTNAGRIIAVSIGDTVVTAYAVDKAGKKTEIGTIAVQVKANAVSVEIEGVPEEGFGIGEYTLTAVQTNARGGAANDAVQFSIPDEYKEIAEITKEGVLTTKKPGAFKINVKTYQNSKLTGATATASVETAAGIKVLTATQKSSTEFNLTADSNLTSDIISANDFKIYYKTGSAEVIVSVKGLAIDSKDATKAVLSTWTSLMAETEYYIQYRTEEPIVVKAAQLRPQDAASIKVTTATADIGELTEIKFAVLDANGIEIPNVSDYVTFSSDDTEICSISSPYITFWEKGKTAKVKATYSAWYNDDNNNWVEKTFSSVFTVTSKDPDPVSVKEMKWTVGGATTSTDTFNSPTYAQNTFVALNDANSYLVLYMKLSDNTEFKNDAWGIHTLTFVSADSNVLVMDGRHIQPIKTGTTQILVYVDDAKTPSAIIPMTVRAKRVPKTLSVSASKNKLNTKTAGEDYIDITVKVTDNYGNAYNGASIVAERVSGTITAFDKNTFSNLSWSNGSATLRINVGAGAGEVDANANGTLALKFSVAGSTTSNYASVSFSAKPDSANTATSYKVNLNGKNRVNTTVIPVSGAAAVAAVSGSSLSDYKLAFTVDEYSKEGYRIGAYAKTVSPDSSNASVGDIVYKLYKGAAEVSNIGTSSKYTIDVNYMAANQINAVAATTATNAAVKKASKLGAGEYTIRLYEVLANGGRKYLAGADAKFTVADDQPSITVTQRVYELSDISLAGIQNGHPINVTYNDNPSVTLANVNGADSALSYSVKEGTVSSVITKITYTISAVDFEFDTSVDTAYVVKKSN